MKYVKLLFIVVLASIVSCTTTKEVPWVGGGTAQLFFGEKDAPISSNEGKPLMENSSVFTQIPITYILDPYSFPFTVDIEVVKVTDNLPIEEVLMITATHLNFTMGPLVDENNDPIDLTNTSSLEVKPVNNISIDKDIEVVLRIINVPDGVTLVQEYSEYTLKITNVPNE